MKRTQKIQEFITVNQGFSLVRLLPPHLPTCTVPSLDSAYGRPLNHSAPLCYGFPPKVLASAIPAGSGSTEVIVKVHTCASTRRCYSLTSLALGLRHRRVLHDPEVGYVRLHRQRLCGSVIPAFRLQGYVSDVSSITTLLDR